MSINEGKNVLVLSAHPDDEVLGCGSTISKLSSNGANVTLMTFTDGVSSRNLEQKSRHSSASKSSEILGISKYIGGDFPDNKMDSIPLLDVVKFIESNLTEKFDYIFTHHPGCLNVDHTVVYRATMTAFRPQYGDKTSIYSYYVPSSTDYNPLNSFTGNTYFSVEQEDVNAKIKCLQDCYDTEMREYPHSRSYENVVNIMKVWGSEVGLKYAEKFHLIRNVV
jgi:LmbE family N-acetylglucosaminyl deacetylase